MGRAQKPDECVRGGGNRSVEGREAGNLLAALGDRDCRVLLQAAAGETLSASELSETCDLPLSTTYRKVDTLTEAGLLEEQLRLSTSGKHTSEYSLAVESVRLSLSGDNIDVEVSDRDAGGPGQSPSVPAGAD